MYSSMSCGRLTFSTNNATSKNECLRLIAVFLPALLADCFWGCRCRPSTLSQGAASVPPARINDNISKNSSRSVGISNIISNSSNVVADSPPLSQGAVSVPSNKTNDKISSSSSGSSSGNIIASNSSNDLVIARAATTPRGSARKDRLSFGPVPKERYSIGSASELLSFSSDDLWPSPLVGRRRSSSLGSAPRQNRQTAAADESINSGNNGSDSLSCVIIDVVGGGANTETNDNHHAYDVERDLLNSSVASVEIESDGLLNGASLSLPPSGEIFSPDLKQQQCQQQQQQQQHDISPVPFIRSSTSGIPDAADFDFDVDEIDAMIGELLEDHDQGHELCLAGEKGGQCENLQQLQEEGGGQQQHQQQQQQQDRELANKQQEQQEDKQRKGDEKEETVEEVERRHETSSIAAAAAAATAKFAAPLKADFKDGSIAEALEGVMALTQRTEASTKDAFARACAVVVQNQVYRYFAHRIALTTA